jgi:hypothetical protein
MRFLTVVKSDESMPAGPPPPELMAGIAQLGERAAKDGTLLDQGGLLWQVRTKEEAVEAARRFMELHADLWPGYEGVCEVRQVMDQPDSPPQQ